MGRLICIRSAAEARTARRLIFPAVLRFIGGWCTPGLLFSPYSLNNYHTTLRLIREYGSRTEEKSRSQGGSTRAWRFLRTPAHFPVHLHALWWEPPTG
jgi:hypothetical protein